MQVEPMYGAQGRRTLWFHASDTPVDDHGSQKLTREIESR